MKRNYLKQNIAWTVLVSVMLTGMLWSGIAYAQEGSVQQIQAETTAEATVQATARELTDEQKQAIAEIVKKLEEVESELMRLSLAVTKLALEEQVLALEQQIAVARAESPASVSQGEEQKDLLASQEEPIQSLTEEGVESVEGGEEDIFARIDIQNEQGNKARDEEEADEKEDRGFLAALGPFGNLGKPELAVLAILVILALFILVRRLRGQKQSHSPVPNIPTSQQPFPQSPQGTFQDGRQEV